MEKAKNTKKISFLQNYLVEEKLIKERTFESSNTNNSLSSMGPCASPDFSVVNRSNSTDSSQTPGHSPFPNGPVNRKLIFETTPDHSSLVKNL